MKRLLLLVSVICSAFPAMAQSYSLGVAAAFEPASAPHSSGVFQFIKGSRSTRPYTSITMRPISKAATFSASAGVIHRLADGVYRLPGSKADRHVFLESFAQAGIVTSGTGNASGLVAGGGSLVFPTRTGLAVVISGEVLVAPINNERQARVSIGLRYEFK